MKVRNLKFYYKELFKGSLAMTLSQLGVKLSGFLLLPLFTSYLSEEDYGVLSMFTLVITLVSLLINPGIVSAITRLYFEVEEEEKPALFASGYTWFISMALTLIVVLTLFGNTLFKVIFQDFQFFPYGLLAVIAALFTSVNRYWTKLMSLQYNMQRVAIFSLLSVVANLIVSVGLITLFNYGVLGRIFGILIGAILLFIVTNIDFLKICNYRLINTKYIPQIWKYASRLSLAVWAYFILNLFDRYMIEALAGIKQLGIYQVGYTLASAPLLVILGASSLWNNIIFENFKNNRLEIIKQLNSLFFTVISFISLGVILLGKEMALLMIHPKFYEIINILPIITVGVYFMSLQIVSAAPLVYEKKFLLLSKIAVVAGAVNIIINYFLIPSYGMMGAALATLVAYFLFFSIPFFISLQNEKPIYNIWDIIISLLLVIMALFYSLFIPSNTFNILELMLELLFMLIISVLIFVKYKADFNLFKLGKNRNKLEKE